MDLHQLACTFEPDRFETVLRTLAIGLLEFARHSKLASTLHLPSTLSSITESNFCPLQAPRHEKNVLTGFLHTDSTTDSKQALHLL